MTPLANTLRQIAKVLVPQPSLLTEAAVETHLQALSRNLRFTFRLALILIEAGGILYRGGRFTRLSAQQKENYLERWRQSPLYFLRLLFKMVESTCYLIYYAHPEVSGKIGFRPPPILPRAVPQDLRGKYSDSLSEDLFLKTDVCVIGSGAGGAVVAKELAEKGRSVVILEEGGYFNVNDFVKEPLGVVQKIYRNAGMQVTFGFPAILLPTGKGVGGTTIINSGTCFRLPDRVFQRWQDQFGLRDLTPQALAPYFERVERELHVTPVGEEILGKNAQIFRKGLQKLGLEGTPLRRNVKDCKGSGMCCFGCPTDAKQSVQLSYIPRAIEKGAKLFTRCRVEGIIPCQEEGGIVTACALDSRTNRVDRTIRVSAKVIVLAAGTLNTPRLLRRNQIALHNRHIGRHLSIHPAAKVAALFEEEIRGWEGVPQGYSYDGMAGEGILFEGVFTPPSYGAVHLDLPARRHREVMEQYAQIASFGFMVTDEGRGSIRWLPNGDPIICYSLRRREVGKFIRATRFLAELFLAAGAKNVFTGLRQLPEVTSEGDLKRMDRVHFNRNDLQLAAFHPLGTCRMGSDPGQGVVNSVGEVFGVKNLLIADGSVFPSPLGVNPQETIMAFANRTADHIDLEILSKAN